MKSRVGSHSEWDAHHQNTSNYSKIKSRYPQSTDRQHHRLNLYQSSLPKELLQLEADLRRERGQDRARGPAASRKKWEIELPKIGRQRQD